MDKLYALPTKQKAAILAVVMALSAGAVYYLLISEMETQITAAQGKEKKLQTEYTALRGYEQAQRQEAVQQERIAAEKKLEDNKKMLPTEDEIPTFIMSIKADADAAGLEVVKFAPEEAELDDYYKRIPIKVEVLGKAQDLVDFFQTLAAPKKRIVNVKQLHVERLTTDVTRIRREMGMESDYDKAAQWSRMAKQERDMTNEEKRMMKLQRWQEANEMNLVRATFVAYTFSYTGEPMPEELRLKQQRRKRY